MATWLEENGGVPNTKGTSQKEKKQAGTRVCVFFFFLITAGKKPFPMLTLHGIVHSNRVAWRHFSTDVMLLILAYLESSSSPCLLGPLLPFCLSIAV